MKIQKDNITKRVILISILVVIMLLLPVGLYGYNRLNQKHATEETSTGLNKVDYNNATDDQKQAGDSIKENSVNKPIEEHVADGESTPNNSTTPVSVTLTAVNQNGTLLNIRSLIDAITNDGTCTLTLTKDTSTVTKTSGIQALATSSTCKGFDIPTSEVSSGEWRVKLDVTTGTKIGSASSQVTIR